GQRIVQGQEAHMLLAAAARVDVGDGAQHAQRAPAAVARGHGATRLHPVPFMRTEPPLHAELDIEALALALQAAAPLGLRAGAVRGVLPLMEPAQAAAGAAATAVVERIEPAEDVLGATRGAEAAFSDLPVPQAIARAFERVGPALLAVAQGAGHALGHGLG